MGYSSVHMIFKRTWTQSRAMIAWALQRTLKFTIGARNYKSYMQLAGDLRPICVQKWVWCMAV
jgi:hypothetical protein